MLSSDPIYDSSLSPAGQWEIWFEQNLTLPKVFLPTGRLHSVPSYMLAEVTWDNLKPPADLLQFFDYPVMQRRLVEHYLPPAIEPVWALYIRPKLAYTFPNFEGSIFGLDPEDNGPTGLFNTTWCLFYGDLTGIDGFGFTDPYDQTSIVSAPYTDTDSRIVDPNGIDDPGSWTGWILCLVHKFITEDAPPALPFANFHSYGAWSLAPEEVIFNPFKKTSWIIKHNPLNYPAHKMTLQPWQA